MAEIPIQRKEGRNVWPMLLGLLLVLAVVWFLFARGNIGTGTAAARADSAAVTSSGRPIRDSAAGTTTNGVPVGATDSARAAPR